MPWHECDISLTTAGQTILIYDLLVSLRILASYTVVVVVVGDDDGATSHVTLALEPTERKCNVIQHFRCVI